MIQIILMVLKAIQGVLFLILEGWMDNIITLLIYSLEMFMRFMAHMNST